MKNKTKILIFVAIVFANIVSAQQVTYSVAKKTAENFYAHNSLNENAKETISLLSCHVENPDTLFYIFNIGKNGFVIISGDYSVTPVLAYSTEGNFIIDQQQQAIQDWLQNYALQISFAKKEKIKVKNSAWRIYQNERIEKSEKITAKGVNPLLTTRWDQGAGYNYHCPAFSSGPDGKCYAGCVATAMAQIMKYFNYPEHGYSSHSYYHPYFIYIFANFDTTYYNWSAMTNVLNNTSKEAISSLIYQCGVSVDMNYMPTGSGANSSDVPQALKNYFHYRPDVSSISKDLYYYKDWNEILHDNLDLHHPVLYSGAGSSGGHAWVCDGYRDSLFFHFNWGWSGANNGYFLLDSINSGNGDFTSGQEAIVNIAPYYAPYCIGNRTFTETTKNISDGSGYSKYWNSTQCEWLIQPADADKIMLIFNDFKTEEGKDFVNIYGGNSTSAPLLGTFSGQDLPPVITANNGEMLITFTSDSINQDFGWDATYTTTGSGIDEKSISDAVIVYPIPAKSEINIVIPAQISGSAILNIYNFTGQTVRSEKVSLDNKTVINTDVSLLNAGIYNIEINTTKYCIHKKFVKQ
ncbi:MAG: T9SS type A sorting domain-containing protein [Bacteroidetes bacterium]|nr:T9SS type A sorting domain-containing protein [Bacteroidota bacterium]